MRVVVTGKLVNYRVAAFESLVARRPTFWRKCVEPAETAPCRETSIASFKWFMTLDGVSSANSASGSQPVDP